MTLKSANSTKNPKNQNSMETLLLSFAAAGLALIVTRSLIFERVRFSFKKEFLATLFSCPQCFGFWAGVLVACIFPCTLNFVVIPFVSSFICYVVERTERDE